MLKKKQTAFCVERLSQKHEDGIIDYNINTSDT